MVGGWARSPGGWAPPNHALPWLRHYPHPQDILNLPYFSAMFFFESNALKEKKGKEQKKRNKTNCSICYKTDK